MVGEVPKIFGKKKEKMREKRKGRKEKSRK